MPGSIANSGSPLIVGEAREQKKVPEFWYPSHYPTDWCFEWKPDLGLDTSKSNEAVIRGWPDPPDGRLAPNDQQKGGLS